MNNELTPDTAIDRPEQDSKRTIVIVVISILLAVNGLLLWQFFDKKTHLEEVSRTLESTLSEKESLSAELQRMKMEYDKINQENASLQNLLSAKDEEIKSKIAQIQKLIASGDAVQLKKAREELAVLKSLNQNYVVQVDSLKQQNRQLADQNTMLNTTLGEERTRAETLTQQNTVLANKVAIGSVLRTIDLKASGVRYKSSGKELETTISSKVKKIKTCFTVLENLVVDKGTKEVYIRIVSPDGAVMSTTSETFDYAGQPTLFTSRETFEYDNKSTPVCVYWAKGSAFTRGKYQVEIYCGGNQIGKTTIELR